MSLVKNGFEFGNTLLFSSKHFGCCRHQVVLMETLFRNLLWHAHASQVLFLELPLCIWDLLASCLAKLMFSS